MFTREDAKHAGELVKVGDWGTAKGVILLSGLGTLLLLRRTSQLECQQVNLHVHSFAIRAVHAESHVSLASILACMFIDMSVTFSFHLFACPQD